MREEDLVIAYLEDSDWYYDKPEPYDVREVGGVYQVAERSSGIKYGATIVSPMDIMIWLHERLLKLEKTDDNI